MTTKKRSASQGAKARRKQGVAPSAPPLLVDTSEGRPVHLLVARNGAHVRLSPSAHYLLSQVRRGVSFEELAKVANRSKGRDEQQVSPQDVAQAYELIEKRLATIEAGSQDLKGGFWLRRRLVPAEMVSKLALPCSVAFRPAAALAISAVIAFGAVLTLRSGLTIDPAQFWSGFGLFLLSLLAHELGHAGACARYGAKPGDIGFTFYLLFPAFYSDVSSAWRLSRWQRVIVDLGGVYFQLLAGAFYAIAYALSLWEPLRVATVLIGGSCLFTLNPFFKFDGYWVIADALGVTNLSQQPSRIFGSLFGRILGQAHKPLPWSPVVTVLLLFYSMVSVGFWGYFLFRLFPVAWLQAANYGDFACAYAKQLADGELPDRETTKSFLASSYMLFFVGIMLVRLARSLLTRLLRFGGGREPSGAVPVRSR